MEGKVETPFLFMNRQFWLTGATMAVCFIALLYLEGYRWVLAVTDTGSAASAEAVRRYPGLDWAFSEWNRCDKGIGRYGGGGYVLVEQCDLAVLHLAAKRGEARQVAAALKDRDYAVSVAIAKVQPDWPLSAFISTESD